MYTGPLNNGDKTETQYAYDAKLFYCMVKCKDTYNELTIKEFVSRFKELLAEVGFEWKHKKKDDTIRIPSYDQIVNKWSVLWKWKECAEAYAKDHLEPQKKQALLIYDKKYLKDTITDFKLIDSYYERIHYLQEQETNNGMDYTYKIAKLEETITSTWNRIRTRLELDKETEAEEILTPVTMNPDFENKTLQENINNALWAMVEKRE